MKSQIQAIANLVRQGLYYDNPSRVLKCCDEAASTPEVADDPHAFVSLFVLKQTIYDVQCNLDEQAIDRDVLKELQGRLGPPILELLEALNLNDDDRQAAASTALIRANYVTGYPFC